MIKNKYLPWIFTVILAALTFQFFGILAAALIGYLAAYHMKRHIIILPFRFLKYIEAKLPTTVLHRPDFTPISSV